MCYQSCFPNLLPKDPRILLQLTPQIPFQAQDSGDCARLGPDAHGEATAQQAGKHPMWHTQNAGEIWPKSSPKGLLRD